MHRIFGIKENEKYLDRVGAYIVPIKGENVGVVQTPTGYFLLGGGIKNNESESRCIVRECLEESGYQVKIGKRVCSAETYYKHPIIGYFHPVQAYYSGELLEKVKEAAEPDHIFKWVKYENIRGKLVMEMQNWALEQVWNDYSIL